MMEIIQSHAKSVFAILALIVFAFAATGCDVEKLPKAVKSRVEQFEGTGSVVVKTPLRGQYSIQFENARQESGFFVCDRLDISGRGFEFHAVNYRRKLVNAQ